MVIASAKFLGPDRTFYDLECPDQILSFLDTKIKSADIDPVKKNGLQLGIIIWCTSNFS